MPKNPCCGTEVPALHECNYYCIPSERLHADILWANPEIPVKSMKAIYNMKHRERACCAFTAAFVLVSLEPITEPPPMPEHVKKYGCNFRPLLSIIRQPATGSGVNA